MVDVLDALDPEFLASWLDAVYDGMYEFFQLCVTAPLLLLVLVLPLQCQGRHHQGL